MSRQPFFLLKAAALAMMFNASATLADMPVTYVDEGRALFRFDVPDFWTVRSGGHRQLSLPGSDDERPVERVIGLRPTAEPHSWVGFISPHGVNTLTQAKEYLREIGPFLVKDATVNASTPRRIGGLPAITFTGQGNRDGKQVEFTAVAIDLPNGRVAVCIVIFEAGVTPANANAVNEIFASFRAIQ